MQLGVLVQVAFWDAVWGAAGCLAVTRAQAAFHPPPQRASSRHFHAQPAASEPVPQLEGDHPIQKRLFPF